MTPDTQETGRGPLLTMSEQDYELVEFIAASNGDETLLKIASREVIALRAEVFRLAEDVARFQANPIGEGAIEWQAEALTEREVSSQLRAEVCRLSALVETAGSDIEQAVYDVMDLDSEARQHGAGPADRIISGIIHAIQDAEDRARNEIIKMVIRSDGPFTSKEIVAAIEKLRESPRLQGSGTRETWQQAMDVAINVVEGISPSQRDAIVTALAKPSFDAATVRRQALDEAIRAVSLLPIELPIQRGTHEHIVAKLVALRDQPQEGTRTKP